MFRRSHLRDVLNVPCCGLSIDVVVASDVEQDNLFQDNFFLGHTERETDAIGMRDTHDMKPF